MKFRQEVGEEKNGTVVDGAATWLVLSYYSGVPTLACSHHLDFRLPIFRSQKCLPVVLSSTAGEKAKLYPHFRIPPLAPSGLRFEVKQWARRKFSPRLARLMTFVLLLPLLPFYLLEKIFLDYDSEWSWCLGAAVRGYLLVRRYKPSVIYSTGGPPSAHLAAAWIARWTGLPWIAEFQDPIVFSKPFNKKRGWMFRSYPRLEKYIFRHADKVVFLTQQALQSSVERTGQGEKCSVIYPGAHPQPFRGKVRGRGEFCVMAHFGSLGGARNLEKLLEALKALYHEQGASRSPSMTTSADDSSHVPSLGPDQSLQVDRLRIVVYGRFDVSVMENVARFPYRDVVQCSGLLSHAESLQAMQESDVLLLVQHRSDLSRETIPSKFYEYLHAQRPIFGLLYGNTEMANILSRSGHYVAEAGNVAEIKKSLRQILVDWQGGKLGDHSDALEKATLVRKEYEEFTIERATRCLVEIGGGLTRQSWHGP